MNVGTVNRVNGARCCGGMGRGLMVALATVAMAAGASYYYQYIAGRPVQAAEGPAPDARVERGRYLVTIGGCGDCHTPLKMTDKGPQPDMDRYLSGHPEQMKLPPAPKAQGPWVWSGAATNTAFAGPWGVTYAANLTPDKNTGLGIWTEQMFVKALRTGKHWGEGRPIMPPMPWEGYGKMTDEDLKAVYAYLQSVRPVRNYVPDYQAPE
jgi:mono/diheme cytochrome c family protein